MATNNRRNDLIRALHGAYQEAENDLKGMKHSRDYWKNKAENLGWGNERKNEWRTPEGECLQCPYCGGWYYQQRTEELEHTIMLNQDKSRLKDERIKQLEQLCRDMYGCATGCTYPQNHRDNFTAKYANRMQTLGLLEEE